MANYIVVATWPFGQIAVKAADVHTFRDQRRQWEAPPGQREILIPEIRTPTKTGGASTGVRGREARPPAVAPPREVRVTQPERVPVLNMPRTPQAAESRYIPKQPPSHPAQEQP